ncbi:peptidylprolyl isomerase [Rhizobiales bacterium]|uniref:FKBP-type peptidyl-prolyl cis-trans isomerase n=1 Tax=Hongsoonwoonella zoysiae TaxID=2821844 RepID=UPI001560BFA1|nr:peptidylprolyl isomerase [Hongsoonwoonella zoysiae]NRG19950.1 peptidylprolyl isomerase [Hongsoonwoonella zoysiae]
MTTAKQGDKVRIHYTGKLTDGTEFDTSAGRDPLEFTVGAGEIISGLDREVDGMEIGEKKSVTIPSGDAYGPHHADRVQQVPRDMIPPEIEPSIGARLQATTGDGNMLVFTVTAADDASVTLDANHPLAGRDLVFDVELVEIA